MRNIPLLRRAARLALLIVVSLLSGACVHEVPHAPDTENYAIDLVFLTDYEQIEHYYDGRSRAGAMPPSRNVCDHGLMRYIIRAFPIVNGEPASVHSREYIMTRDISTGYDTSFELSLPPGDYRLMIWSDLYEFEGDDPLYTVETFHEISLYGDHSPNNDYRDAFKGTADIEVESFVVEHDLPRRTIFMERPLAKFEFVTTDLMEFLEREKRSEQTTAKSSPEAAPLDPQETDSRTVSLDDYKVVMHYVGYMPSTYSMIADKPVDSKTGVKFDSKLTQISDDEATMGFDHVFVNGTQTSVTVQLELLNRAGEQVSLTAPITVPLRRSNHTIVRGSFLMTESTGGTGIDPEYDGDYNLFF